MPARLPEPMQYAGADSAPYLQYSAFNESPTNRVRLACLVQLLAAEIPAGRRILEIGCGAGNIAIPLASLGYQVTACDIHAPSLEAARRRNPFANLRFIHGSAEQAPLGEYDAIILTEVLEHVQQYREMIARLAGAMKSDCVLIITVPNGWGITELCCRPSYALKKWPLGAALVKVIKRLLKTADLTTANLATPHVHFFTLRHLTGLFAEYHLTVAAFRRFFFLWPLWEVFFSQRSYPAGWPEKDFYRSQKLPPAWCAYWAFALKRR